MPYPIVFGEVTYVPIAEGVYIPSDASPNGLENKLQISKLANNINSNSSKVTVTRKREFPLPDGSPENYTAIASASLTLDFPVDVEVTPANVRLLVANLNVFLTDDNIRRLLIGER